MGVQLPDTATAATVTPTDVPVKPDQPTEPANNGVDLESGDVKNAAVIDIDGTEKIKAKVADADNNGVAKPDDTVTTDADADPNAEPEKDAENGAAKEADGEAVAPAKDDDDEADEDFAEDGENDDDDDDDDEVDDDDDDEEGEDDDSEGGEGGEGAKMGLTSEMVSQFLPKELIGSKALLAAAKDNDIDTITTLLEASPEAGEDGEKIGKVDINAKDPYEYTALHLASEGGAVEVVKKLLEHKSDMELPTRMHQCRPLHYGKISNFPLNYFLMQRFSKLRLIT